MKDSIKIAIAGATGYIGLELIKILIKHPKAEIIYLCAFGKPSQYQHLYGKVHQVTEMNIKS